MKKEIFEMCKGLSLSDIMSLREELRDLYREKFDSMYKTVRIHPGERIEEKIKAETGFHCYHEPAPGYSMGRGTHVIVIPIDKWSEDLKNSLIAKYDDKW